MIPQGNTIRNEPVQEQQQPSRTWRIDFDKGRVTGMIDGLEAVKQTVFCILNTERFRYLIHSFNYGHELGQAVGRSRLFIESDVKRLIREALMQDDRITEVDSFIMQFEDYSLMVKFRVLTDVGSFDEEVELSV